MASLLSGTTIGGHVAVHANNISTYALTSIPATISPTNVYIGNAIYFGGGNNYFNWDGARINSNVGIQSTSDMRAPIFYDSNDTTYYTDPNSTSRLRNIWVRGDNQYEGYIYVGGDSAGARLNINFDQVWTATGNLHFQYSSAGNIDMNAGGGYTFSRTSLRAPIFYDYNDTNYYLDPNSSGTSLRIAGGIAQNNIVGRPYAAWGASGGATGAVVIKFPGGTGNYGMVHAVVDIYEYNGNDVSTVIIGGHNWNGAWYSYGAQVIGTTNKQVRLGVKDGKYCIVIGDGSSSWSYGQVVLRKIQNGTYYDGAMNVAEGYTAAIESDSYSWISDDLRNLETPSNFYAGGNVSAGAGISASGIISSSTRISTTGTNTLPIDITGASHKYLTINPGNGYEAMVRYIGGSGSSWYVGKRTSSQLVGTQSFHFYSEEAGATVGGITPGGDMHATGSMRAPIFYDSNNTDYYLDPASTGTSFRGRGEIFLGPNSSGEYTRLGGNGGAVDHATVSSSNGNLHIDCKANYGLYLNYYSRDTIWLGQSGRITDDGTYYNGTAAAANSVAWTNVSSRPTALSQFTNDLGNYGGWITTDGRAYPRRSDGTSINFYWDGQGGQPTWLWGSNNGTDFYVWNPSNFSVNYATSAGSATSSSYLTGGDSAFYGLLYNSLAGNLNTYNSPGLYSAEYVGSTNRPFGQGGHFIQISDAGGTDVKTQWYYGSAGADIAMRLMWGNGDWKAWRTLVHDGNIGSQSVSYADESGYSGSTGSVEWTNVNSRPTALSQFTNDSGYITGVTNISGYANNLYSQDIRTIAPNTHGAYRLNFGFTSWNNNNTAPWADYIHLRSYSDATGGADNLITFLKSGIGMRIWQQSFASGTAYSSYVDVITSGNIGSQSVNYATSAGNADTVDSLHASSFVRSDQNAVTIQRHLDASTTWTNDALTLFLGWYSGKLVVGNNNEGNHDNASALGGNTIAITNTLYSFEQSNLYYDGSLKLYMGTDGTRNTGWAYHTNNGTGLHWPNNGWHIYPVNASDMYIRSGASDCSLKFTKSGESGSYVHCSADNDIGFLTTGRSWSLRVDNSGNAFATSSFRAPIFYDSNDTGYYLDPNGTSNLLQLTTATRARWNMPRTWYDRSSRTSDEGYWTGTNGWSTADGTWAGAWQGGFSGWDIWGTGTDHPQGGGYVHAQGIVSGQHYATSSVGYGWMMVGAHNATDNRYWLRGKWDTSTSGWTEMMTSNQNPIAWNMDQYVRTSDSVSFNSTTSPTFLVNNQSDNTKGYRIYNTSNASVSAMFTNSANALVIGAGAFDQVQLNKKVLVSGAALGVNVAASATAGRIDASNDIVAYSSSDERLKQNITPIENALDKVKSLTGVEFDWKPEYKHAHGYEGHDTGIIAQQVQKVIPSAVRTNDTGFLAVRYEKLIGLLVEGMKEQQAQIEELKAKLDGITK